ncbi:phospholipase D-like domain-containing protein [Marinobacter sp. M216]|uniref:Phospholipase D-like domain-containing protein n=1 Tax=Marinobacter albus TaxID=3030833 RepID=A0ABT7HFM4_9GAMM|nr:MULTISPECIES: phospholipase D-like domain-containing protein [unclassified Marinobacter]MBW7472628.1 phospholipase [Marinobacter sp. F4218]MDK9559181.1 phospholipase D-like domain-containing protein [Marinobacter sp. M216]
MTLKLLIALFFLLLAGIGLYHTNKPLPAGISYRGTPSPLENPVLLTDVTRHHTDGTETLDHEIFDEVLRLIGSAEKFVLVDMFLYNSTQPEGAAHRPLAKQLTEALLARKQARPEIAMIVISDPLNTMYGGSRSPWFEALREAGITVVETRLPPLRDSNPAWSSLWRPCCQWLGNDPDGGWLSNALGNRLVTVRSYLALLNFKANHRKLLVVDQGSRLRGLVTSANPHDGSSRHGNIGLSFTGKAVADLLKSEQAVLAMSGADTSAVDRWITIAENRKAPVADSRTAAPDTGRVMVLTESAIRDKALDMIDRAGPGDHLDLAVFYLSHRGIVDSLLEAHLRGAILRVLLDANNEAFGHSKSGVPNRQAALELHRAGASVRWCNTRGEQCHSKLLMLRPEQGHIEILLGSANFTRRNLDDLNLETNVWLSLASSAAPAAKAVHFFNEQWRLGPGNDPVMSLPYEAWADDSRVRYWRYRIMEFTGLSTF